MKWFFEEFGSSIISFIVGSILTWILVNRKNLKIAILSYINSKKEYRVSMSYLFRIKIENKYLLIKGKNIEQYQPVGGVYKYYASFSDMLNKYEIRPESGNSFYEENDLRVYVKGKYLSNLIIWFNSRLNREYNVYRELLEEFKENGIELTNDLLDIQIELIRNVNSGVHYSTHFRKNEVLLYDIFDVRLNDQTIEMIKEKLSENNQLVLVDFVEIESECVNIDNKSCKIGIHAKYLR